MTPPRTRSEVLEYLAAIRAKAGPLRLPERTFRTAPRDPIVAPPSNGGPRLYDSPLEELTDIGRSLYGERWMGDLAADLGEHERQVRRWVRGEAAMPSDVLHWARIAVRAHQARIARLATRLGMDATDPI